MPIEPFWDRRTRIILTIIATIAAVCLFFAERRPRPRPVDPTLRIPLDQVPRPDRPAR